MTSCSDVADEQALALAYVRQSGEFLALRPRLDQRSGTVSDVLSWGSPERRPVVVMSIVRSSIVEEASMGQRLAYVLLIGRRRPPGMHRHRSPPRRSPPAVLRPARLSGGLAGQPDRTGGADRQVVAGGQGRGQGIELRDVTGTELVLQAVPGAAEGDHGVAGHGGGHRRVRRRLQRDHEAAFGLDRETGFGETGRPVLMHVHAGLVTPPSHGGVDPLLERRARRVGEKTRERLQLRDREQSPWAQHLVDLRDRPCGIAHVVQRVGGPHEVSGLQAIRPCLIKVGLDGADPVGEPGRAGLVLDLLQHLLVDVQRDQFGVRQLPGQRQGAGARAGTHVDDAGSFREVCRDPFGYLPVVLAEDLRVEVEQVSHVFVCHVLDGTAALPLRHTLLRMKQDADLDALVRQRIRGLRTSLGWSLDELAARRYLSPSTLSRIETGHRRIALDQLTPIPRALGTTLDQLGEADDHADVVIPPLRAEAPGMTTSLLSRTGAPRGMTIAKLRVTRKVPARLRVHPGRDWFTVLSGTIVLRLGERTILVRAGEAAEVSTMDPHAFGVLEEAEEILCILDHDGTRTHLGPGGPFPETGSEED